MGMLPALAPTGGRKRGGPKLSISAGIEPCRLNQGILIVPPPRNSTRDLGLGALLVMDGNLTAGRTIAASILLGLALAPIEMAGKYLGYLLQHVELFSGTVGENIVRMDESAEAADVVAAAQQASVHEIVLSLPRGTTPA